MKGKIYISENKLSKAEISFKEAIKINPDFLNAYYSLADIYMRDNRINEATSQYKAMLSNNPKLSKANMMLGVIYENQKDYEKAEKYYRAVLEIAPSFAPAGNNLAYILLQKEDSINEALVFAQKAREFAPNSPEIMDTLGMVYYKKGLYGNAVNQFLDSLEKLPKNPEIHYHLGLAYSKKGEKEKAKTSLRKALSLNDKFEGADDAKTILTEL